MKCLDQQGLKYLWSLIEDNFATRNEVTNHTGNTANPHNVTKAQIGLGEFDYEVGTWTPNSPVLSGIDSYKATYVKVGNLVYCNFTLEGMRTKEKQFFTLTGLPYVARMDVNEMAIGTMHCSTETSSTDSKSGFIDSEGTENEQIVNVHLQGATTIKGRFRKKYQNCYLPGYNSNAAVTIKGTFIYRTTVTKK